MPQKTSGSHPVPGIPCNTSATRDRLPVPAVFVPPPPVRDSCRTVVPTRIATARLAKTPKQLGRPHPPSHGWGRRFNPYSAHHQNRRNPPLSECFARSRLDTRGRSRREQDGKTGGSWGRMFRSRSRAPVAGCRCDAPASRERSRNSHAAVFAVRLTPPCTDLSSLLDVIRQPSASVFAPVPLRPVPIRVPRAAGPSSGYFAPICPVASDPGQASE
jgi:hypothetical protein